MTVPYFGAPQTTRRRLCNDNHETKKVSIVLYSKHSDAFLVLARPRPPTPANLLSFVSCVYRNEDIERKKNNGRDKRLRRSNSGRGNNGCVFCPFSFVFLSFLLLTLRPDHLLYREVGFDQRHGGQRRFDWQGGRRRLIRALLVRLGGGAGTCSDIFLFSSLLLSSSHCSCFPMISFFAKIT